MAVAHWAVAACTDVAAQAGIWRGCDLLFPNLWLVYYCWLRVRFDFDGIWADTAVPTSCLLSLPDPTCIKIFLFAAV